MTNEERKILFPGDTWIAFRELPKALKSAGITLGAWKEIKKRKKHSPNSLRYLAGASDLAHEISSKMLLLQGYLRIVRPPRQRRTT